MKEVSVGLYTIIGQVKTSTTVMFGSFFLGEEVSASASFAFHPYNCSGRCFNDHRAL